MNLVFRKSLANDITADEKQHVGFSAGAVSGPLRCQAAMTHTPFSTRWRNEFGMHTNGAKLDKNEVHDECGISVQYFKGESDK